MEKTSDSPAPLQTELPEIPGSETPPVLPEEPQAQRLARLHEKARALPAAPGVYLLKDRRGVVLYVGKSRDLHQRVGGYFVPSVDLGGKKRRLLDYVCDFDTLETDSEVEALLMENRLIKDLKPRFNALLTDGKSYPYLEITTREDFPGVYLTRTPRSTGTKLYGPFTSVHALREALLYLQRAFKFRTCHLDIRADEPKNRFFRPCLLYAIQQCSAPCANKISREAYRQDLEQFKNFLDNRQGRALRQMTAQMEAASAAQDFEQAAVRRDQIRALQALSLRGRPRQAWQPEIFFRDHQAGLKQLQEILGLDEPVRCIEAIDIAHFQGEATVGALVCFIDGRPFKNGYRRFRIRGVSGIDDYRCIQEVIARRYREAAAGQSLYPDLILIDGGRGQLRAALEAFSPMPVRPPLVISLAKRQEEIFLASRPLPFKLPRTSAALKLLQAVRDEAHRFAQHYHHLLIARRQLEHRPSGSRESRATTTPVSQVGPIPRDGRSEGVTGGLQRAEMKIRSMRQLRRLVRPRPPDITIALSSAKFPVGERSLDLPPNPKHRPSGRRSESPAATQ